MPTRSTPIQRKTTIVLALSLPLLAAGSIGGAGEANANLVCYQGGSIGLGRVYGEGAGATKSSAQMWARERWRDAAQKAMGSTRARNWDVARHKSYYCTRPFRWNCTAYGQPCM